MLEHVKKHDLPAVAVRRARSNVQTVTDKISGIILTPRTPIAWFLGFAFGFSLLQLLLVSITYLLFKGVGIWGVNQPVGWGLDIINFVWWIGIGHAGTLISAVLLLFRQQWRMSISRAAEAMTIFAVACAAIFPLIPHRPSVAVGVLAVPVPERDGASGRTSAARSSGTCSRSRPTAPSRSCSGTSA